MASKNIWISPDSDQWKAQKEGAERASRIFDTQRDAENYGRNVLQNNGGGELITQNQHGQIRSKDTINSNDPISRKDTEH
ncbi:DUF2188 domain-containing protein [Candidatus Daviesbacteria bacterium]|nr:DUF2188 domain-containing protein [Candidatus Daviesbacteria bacterium]